MNVAAIQGTQAAPEEGPEFGVVAKYWRRRVMCRWQAHMFLVEPIGGDGEKDLSEVAIDMISTFHELKKLLLTGIWLSLQ